MVKNKPKKARRSTKKVSNLEKISVLGSCLGESWYLGLYSGTYHFNSFNKKGVRLISLKAGSASDLADLLRYEIDSGVFLKRQKTSNKKGKRL